MKFEDKINDALYGPILCEGTILPINKIVSSVTGVPEGRYLIQSVNNGKCVLIPTSENSGQRFEVFTRTLEGFFNPEIHTRVVDNSSNILAEKKYVKRRKMD